MIPSAILIGIIITLGGADVYGQGRAASRMESTAESVRWLKTVIEGNAVEVKSQASNNSEKYRYEDSNYDNCKIQLREVHETFNADAGRLLTMQEMLIPLSILDPSSVVADKVGRSVYLVSFNTAGMKAAITAHQKVERAGESEETISAQSGYGIYFGKAQTAQRVARSLVVAVRSCQKR